MEDCLSPLSVALIDSNPNDRKSLSASLQGLYTLTQYANADAAFAGMTKAPPAVFIVDEMLSPCGAYEFVTMIRQDHLLGGIPAIIVSGLDLANVKTAIQRCGGNGYLSKPWRVDVVVKAISKHLNRAVEKRWEVLPETQRSALTSTLEVMNTVEGALKTGEPIKYNDLKKPCIALVKAVCEGNIMSVLGAVRDHDNYTFSHSFKVAMMLAMFGKAIGLSDKDQHLLASGGLLHDVGKMEIPLDILNKPAKLSPEEWVIMKRHVPTTMEFLTTCYDIPKGALIIAAQHHEKLDGTGYPDGLSGAQINELARMAAIADVYGALTDRRTYKPAMEPEAAFGIMTEHMATHLDMGLLKVFREVVLDHSKETPVSH